MKVYTYSKARQQLSRLLDEAAKDGEVQIVRRNGKTYVIKPLNEFASPLDIEGLSLKMPLDELNEIVREGRER